MISSKKISIRSFKTEGNVAIKITGCYLWNKLE